MSSYLKLLGSPEASVAGRPVPTSFNLAATLLCYLAYHDSWLSREQLTGMVWPDTDEHTARRNFRQILHRARKVAWAQTVETTPTHIRFEVDTDIKAFKDALNEEDWSAAVGLYQGPLLEGVSMSGVAALENWHGAAQQTLHGLWREALQQRAEELSAEARYGEAADLLKKGLEQDPLAEDLLTAYLTNSYASGQRDQALKAYESFCTTLQQELDVEPLEETVLLADIIKNAEPLPLMTSEHQSHQSPLSVSLPLPTPATPFVGRGFELSTLSRLLEDPNERLISILGLGGVGKSRLALELATLNQTKFNSGTAFVPLAEVESVDLMPSALASAINLTLREKETSEKQLLSYFKHKHFLLVLDNFEHLLAAAPLVTDLLGAAPNLHVVTTSREPLGVRGESRFELTGLSYPQAGEERLETSEAAELFTRSARRADARFSLSDKNKANILQICERLEGMPLALELAAAWTPLLSCQAIAEELRQGLDLLTSEAPDLPERHSSLRAVFEHSWQLLSEREKNLIPRLAVFQGGFDKKAAEQVAGAQATDLLTLLGKSLLRRGGERFDLHPLIHQFAEEKLRAKADLEAEAKAVHSHHYLTWLANQEGALGTREQAKTFRAIQTETANLAPAWANAVKLAQVGLLENALDSYFNYLSETCKAQEGYARFSELVGALKPSSHPKLLAKAEARLATFLVLRGELHRARTLLEKRLASTERGSERMFVLRRLAAVLHQLGEPEQRTAYLLEALSLSRELGNVREQALTLGNLGIDAWAVGDYEAATRYDEESLSLFTHLGDEAKQAKVLGFLGMIANAQGRYELALERFGKCLPLLEASGDRVEFGFVTSATGYSYWKLGDYETALKPISEAYALFKELEHAFYFTLCANAMGETLLVLEGEAEARPYFKEALTTALEHSITNYILMAIMGFAGLVEDKLEAAALLQFVHEHPATWHMEKRETKERLEQLDLSAEQLDAVQEKIRGWKLETVATNLLHR